MVVNLKDLKVKKRQIEVERLRPKRPQTPLFIGEPPVVDKGLDVFAKKPLEQRTEQDVALREQEIKGEEAIAGFQETEGQFKKGQAEELLREKAQIEAVDEGRMGTDAIFIRGLKREGRFIADVLKNTLEVASIAKKIPIISNVVTTFGGKTTLPSTKKMEDLFNDGKALLDRDITAIKEGRGDALTTIRHIDKMQQSINKLNSQLNLIDRSEILYYLADGKDIQADIEDYTDILNDMREQVIQETARVAMNPPVIEQ